MRSGISSTITQMLPVMTERFLYPSYIELSRKALQNNIRFLKSRAPDGVRISSVIKGNAYGHGIETFLPMAEECGVDHFAVFSADEAERALKARKHPGTDIMIMGMIRNEEIKWAIKHGIEFYLFEEDRLDQAGKISGTLNIPAKVHLQLETGMNRTGFPEESWEKIFSKVQDSGNRFQVRGICTHYAGAESMVNHRRVHQQDEAFRRAAALAEKLFKKMPLLHAASSAAFLTYPDMHYDMVRLGISMFGFWPSRETYMHVLKENNTYASDPLERVLSWKSEIMNTKWVDEGEYIGYGNIYLAGTRMKIATVPIGYTHGFGRNLTNTGYVLIRGERARVAGLVNMNMITVDISDIPEAQKGDEVVIIGAQDGQHITVASFSEMTNNLNYEVLTRLPHDLPRKILS